MSFLRADENLTRYCCHTGCGRKNWEPHAPTCPRRNVLRLDPRCGHCVMQVQHTLDEHASAIAAYLRHAPEEGHLCGDPIRCSTCLAERATKATARRAASRKGASRRAH